jgi:DNA topoisomerase-1
MDHKLYLSDKGIYRTNGQFYYHKNNQIVTDPRLLERLSRLVVPPAWTQVWFACNPKCHIQVHGIDTGGKKQYILSQQWVNHAKYEKFNRMKRFIKDLASFKRKIKLNGIVITRETLIKLLFQLLIPIKLLFQLLLLVQMLLF